MKHNYELRHFCLYLDYTYMERFPDDPRKYI